MQHLGHEAQLKRASVITRDGARHTMVSLSRVPYPIGHKSCKPNRPVHDISRNDCIYELAIAPTTDDDGDSGKGGIGKRRKRIATAGRGDGTAAGLPWGGVGMATTRTALPHARAQNCTREFS